MKKSAKP